MCWIQLNLPHVNEKDPTVSCKIRECKFSGQADSENLIDAPQGHERT
jgi:hypothetical protein